MNGQILCIDIGTTSLKAALLSDGRTVEAFSRVALKAGGAAANAASGWLPALAAAVGEMRRQNPAASAEAVCVSGNGPTLVLEAGGNALATLPWNAPIPRTPAGTRSLFVPRILGARSLFPAEWAAAESVCSGPEFLVRLLSGRRLTILPRGFEGAYWTDEELSRLGFGAEERARLPPFAPTGSRAGSVTAEAAGATGIAGGTPVFAGAPDFIAALVGTATVRAGTACDRAGSSEGVNLCTKRPLRADGIRVLPAAAEGLWNASVLIPDSGRRKDADPEGLLRDFSRAVDALRRAASDAGEPFPDEIAMTGGQCLDPEWVRRKEAAAGIRIRIPFCRDAELVGDLVMARLSLGDYGSLDEACSALCRFQ